MELPENPTFWAGRIRLRSEVRLGTPDRDSMVARALESATRTPTGNGIRFHQRRWTRRWADGFPMSDSEVALTMPTPDCFVAGEVDGSGVESASLLALGRTAAGIAIGPPIEPHQGRHLAVLGETGMGKSSLLVALSRRIVSGAGLVLFDPLGETADAVRAEIAPAVSGRLTHIDPETAPGLNALEGIGPESTLRIAQRERRLNDLVHSLRRVRSGRYVDSGFWGPRLEEMLLRALGAAASLPEGTLEDAHALLACGGRGFRTLPPEAQGPVGELADRIRSRPEDADGARRLLFEVIRNPLLTRAFCRRSPETRVQDLLGPGRILLVSGDAANVGESTARYLLSVYLALVWSELLARSNGAKTFVVLDEAQWFAHESLAEMLRLGRRRNIHVVVATQAIASLPEAVAESIWTNVADFVGFRGSPEEAREFSRLVHGISPESILSLPRGEAALLLGKGNSFHWVRTARVPRRTAGVALEAVPWRSPVREAPLALFLEMLRRSVPDGDPAVVRISLAELRRAIGPNERDLRGLGSRLARGGAIVRRGRDDHGACWWVDRQRVEELALTSALEEGPERSAE
ncbi:MAG: DUF87 domain-containing protein [Thermoplasmata archaeon]